MTALALVRRPGDLELPRPLRLLLPAGWSLAESAGLPVAAYVIAALIDGRSAGLVAGLAVIWLTAAVRRAVTGSVPGLLTISALRARSAASLRSARRRSAVSVSVTGRRTTSGVGICRASSPPMTSGQSS
jgi:hypothetical protein